MASPRSYGTTVLTLSSNEMAIFHHKRRVARDDSDKKFDHLDNIKSYGLGND